jgi:hypothetical protein
MFFGAHVASRFGLPEVIENRRNALWFVMSVAVFVMLAFAAFAAFAARVVRSDRARYTGPILAAIGIVIWFTRVPNVWAEPFRGRLLNYSGYGMTAYAVLRIEERYEPFTWTVVTYGQEFPMVLGRGFHLAAADFLEKYDPRQPLVPIPTKYIFIVVEKNPHPFEINTWARNFSRADLEQRLQTWCDLYQFSHKSLRIFTDDDNVRVYMIERSDKEMERIAKEAGR